MRRVLLTWGMLLAACGEGVAPAGEVEAGAGAAPATPEVAAPIAAAAIPARAATVELAAAPVVTSASASATAGQRVQWVLGMMSCGFMEQARGDAHVVGNTLQVPAPEDWARLYLRVGGPTCSDGDAFLEADVAADGTVSLDQATPTYLGCWFFENL